MGTDPARRTPRGEAPPELARPDLPLPRVAAAASLVALVLAALALVGWGTGNLLLAGVRADFVPMAPDTAVAFVLLAATSLTSWRRRWLPRVVAVVIVAITVHARIVGEGLGASGRLGAFPLGVMSPVTAVTFLLAATALFALSTSRLRSSAVPCALLIVTVGLVSVVGYVYGTPLLYQGSVIPIALTTGMSFLAMGAALLVRVGPEAWPARVFVGTSVRARMTRVLVPTVILLTLAQGWLAILIASGPWGNPAVFAASLAAASIPITAIIVSRLSKRIGDVIERAEDRRREAEEQRMRLEACERSSMALARQKEDLTRLVVHDLKNPLTTILMGVELLRSPVLDAVRFDRIAGDVMTAAISMDRLTLDMLDISRSDDGALVPRLQAVNLPGLLTKIVQSMRLRTSESGVDVVLSSSLSDPEIQADPQLVQRVIENLLDNSLKYAPRNRPIRIDVRDVGDAMVEVRVTDEGPGVPVESDEQIFEKYARLDRDEANSVRGSRGLGLAFCRLAVEAHGGKIWVEDDHSGGSRFCVRLPRSPAPVRTIRASMPARSLVPSEAGRA